jgi:hypothetical protein
MLQRYPDLAKKVTLFISIAGFTHEDDFVFTKTRMLSYRLGAGLFSLPLAASFFRRVCLNKYILHAVYRHTHNAKDKFKSVAAEEVKEIMDFEVRLWHDNDVRTYMKTTSEFLRLDNTTVHIDLPVYHVAVAADRYFDNRVVEQHMEIIFKEYHLLATLDVANHAPSVLADAKAAAPFVPPRLRRLLSDLEKKK